MMEDWVASAFDIVARWFWVPALAALGGIMAALDRARRGQHSFWSMRTAYGVVASSIAGSLVFMVLQYYGVVGLMLGALTGAGGYIGPRLIDDLYDRLLVMIDKGKMP